MDTIRDKWINKCNSCPKLDEAKARKFVNFVYGLCDIPPPKLVFVDSPYGCQIAINLLRSQIGSQVGSQVRSQVGSQVWSQVASQVGSQVWSQVRSQVESQIGIEFELFSYYGDVSDYVWLSYYDFFSSIGMVKNKNYEEFSRLLFESGIFMMIVFDNACVISRFPKNIERDEKNRLSNKTGPAIEFNDGWKLYCVNGVNFPEDLFTRAFIDGFLTSEEILAVKNAEQRAIIIQHYGYESIIHNLDSKLLDTYTGMSQITGMPVKYELIEFVLDRNKYRVVQVEDHTLHKKVTLGVPVTGGTSSCLGAIAWTFGMTESEYKPLIES